MSFLKFQDSIFFSITPLFFFYYALKIVWREKTERGILGKSLNNCTKNQIIKCFSWFG